MADREIRWLHLSDVHLTPAENEGRPPSQEVNQVLTLERFWAYLKEDPHGLKPVDLVFFTGDLAYHGMPSEYRNHVIPFLDQFIDATGVNREHLLLVAGNHDVARNEILKGIADDDHRLTKNDQITDWLAARAEPYANERKERLKRLKAYCSFYRKFFGTPNDTPEEILWYNKKFDIRGVRVGVVGACSAWLSGSGDKLGKGEDADDRRLSLGECMLSKHLKEIEDREVRFVLHHHPPDWLIAEERNQVARMLSRHGVLQLYGHVHVGSLTNAVTPHGGLLQIQAGSLYARREWANGFYRGTVSVERRQGTLRQVIFKDDNWAPDLAWSDPGPHFTDGVYHFDLPRRGDAPPGTATRIHTPHPPTPQPVVNYIDRRKFDEAFDLVASQHDGRWLLNLAGLAGTGKTAFMQMKRRADIEAGRIVMSLDMNPSVNCGDIARQIHRSVAPHIDPLLADRLASLVEHRRQILDAVIPSGPDETVRIQKSLTREAYSEHRVVEGSSSAGGQPSASEPVSAYLINPHKLPMYLALQDPADVLPIGALGTMGEFSLASMSASGSEMRRQIVLPNLAILAGKFTPAPVSSFSSTVVRKRSYERVDVAPTWQEEARTFAREVAELLCVLDNRTVRVYIDTFESIRSVAVKEWLVNNLLPALRESMPGMVVVLAGQKTLTEEMGGGVAIPSEHRHSVSADEFSNTEAQEYLGKVGVRDPELAEELLMYSGRLPIILDFFAEIHRRSGGGMRASDLRGGDARKHLDQRERQEYLVEHILHRLPNRELERILRYAAIARHFDASLLSHLMGSTIPDSLWKEFHSWSFVCEADTPGSMPFKLHDTVRRILRGTEHEDTFGGRSAREVHAAAAHYMTEQVERASACPDHPLANSGRILDALYHLCRSGDEGALRNFFIREFAEAIESSSDENLVLCSAMIDAIPKDPGAPTSEFSRLLQALRCGRNAIAEKDLTGIPSALDPLIESDAVRFESKGSLIRASATIFRRRGAVEEARRCLHARVELAPQETLSILDLADLELLQGNLTLARTLADRALALEDRHRVRASTLKAAILVKSGDRGQAAAILHDARQRMAHGSASERGGDWIEIGRAYLELFRRTEDALGCFEAATDDGGTAAKAWEEIGDLHRDERKDFSAAKTAYLRAYEIDPRRVSALDNLLNAAEGLAGDDEVNYALGKLDATGPLGRIKATAWRAGLAKKQGRWKDAAVLFENAAELYPKQRADALAHAVECLLKAGQEEDAFRRAEESSEPETLIPIAAYCEREGRWQDAVGYYRRIAEASKDHRGEAWEHIGDIQRDHGKDFPAAQEAYLHAVAVEPGRLSALVGLVGASRALAGEQEVEKVLQRLEETRDEGRITVAVLRAMDFERTGRWQDAVEWHGRVADLSQQARAAAWEHIGDIQRDHMKDFPAAREAYLRSLEAEPGRLGSLRGLALAAYTLAGEQEAEESLRRLEETGNEGRAEAASFRGLRCERSGLWHEAVEWHRRVADLSPQIRATAWEHVGDILRNRMNNSPAAREAYLRSLDAEPGRLTALHEIANIAAAAGADKEFDGAVGQLEASGSTGQSLAALARANRSEALGRWDEAVRWHGRVAEISDKYRAAAWERIGDIHRDRMNDFLAAREAYLRSLEAEPGRLSAVQGLAMTAAAAGMEKEFEDAAGQLETKVRIPINPTTVPTCRP